MTRSSAGKPSEVVPYHLKNERSAAHLRIRGRAGGPAHGGNYAGVVTIPTLEELLASGPRQQPSWPDASALADAVRDLRSKPPLVFAGECDDLKAKLAKVAAGQAFLLQGGDCAETFDGVTAENVRAKLQVLLQMAVVLTYGASVPVVKVGRIAGQYAKPRSSDSEVREGVQLPAYRGDAVNGFEFSATSRRPDPARLVQVYNSSAAIAAQPVSCLSCKEASPTSRQMHAWNTDFVRTSPVGAVYERLAGDIERALSFMKAIGAESEELHRVAFHSSHEALILEYEHALTRIDSRDPSCRTTSQATSSGSVSARASWTAPMSS